MFTPAEVRRMPKDEALAEIAKLRREIHAERIALHMRTAKNSAQYKAKKRALSRMLTIHKHGAVTAPTPATTAPKATKTAKKPLRAKATSRTVSAR